MPQCQIHHLAFTIPLPLTAAELPQIVEELFKISGLDPAAVRLPRGRSGYREAFSLTGPHGAELLSIQLAGVARNVKGTAHFVVHGDAFETKGFDVLHLCREIMARRGWVTRVDLAADDHDAILPWTEIVEACGQWENRITTTTCRPRLNRKTGEMEPFPPVYLREVGETLYLGKADSDLSICLYNRRGPVRVETRIRNRAAATDVIRRIAEGEDTGAVTTGILSRNLTFHVAGFRRKDRRPACDWWTQFLGNTTPIKLPRQREDRHRSPWYVPPTVAEKKRKAVQRLLEGDDGSTLAMLRELIADHDVERAVAAFATG